MKRYFVVLSVALVALSGCAKKVDLEAERAALRQADADWVAAVASKNPETFSSFFAQDAVVIAPHLPLVSGMDAIRGWATESMAFPGFAVTWETTSLEVAAAGDMAYTLGTFTFQMTMPDGTPMNDRGKFATIWKKQADGSWKVVVDAFNSEIPMVPMPGDTTAVQGQ